MTRKRNAPGTPEIVPTRRVDITFPLAEGMVARIIGKADKPEEAVLAIHGKEDGAAVCTEITTLASLAVLYERLGEFFMRMQSAGDH